MVYDFRQIPALFDPVYYIPYISLRKTLRKIMEKQLENREFSEGKWKKLKNLGRRSYMGVFYQKRGLGGLKRQFKPCKNTL